MILERAVLFGIQHLEQGRGHVAVEALAHLVHFVEQKEDGLLRDTELCFNIGNLA